MAKLVTLQDVKSQETIYPVTITSAVFNPGGESIDTIVSNIENNAIKEAPVNGKSYARKDGNWTEIPTTGGGVADSVEWDNVLNKPTIPDGTYVLAKDIRSTNYSPFQQQVSTSKNAGLYDITIKNNNSDNWATQISGASTDGYHGTANLRYYPDSSGGAEYQLGFGNDIIAYRTGTTSWGNWTVLAKQSDINTINNKLDGIATGATKVEFTRNVTSGTKIGTITINDIDTDIFAPTSGGTTSDTNTTYTFTSGTNGSFTVKPSDGSAQTVTVVDLSEYATQSWVNNQNFATESYVTEAINNATIEGGGGITSISQNTSGSGTGRIVTNVSGSTVYTRLLQTSDVTSILDGTDINDILSSSSTNISSSNLPIATKTSLGIIQVGGGLNITAAGVVSATWDSLSGKPSTFTPSSHTHPFNQITFNNTGTSSQYLAGDGNFHTISYSQISGVPNLSNYATKDQLDGLATESWVTDQINEISSSGGGGIQSISQSTTGSGTGRLVTSVSGSTVYVRSMTSSDVTGALGFTPTSLSSVQSWANETFVTDTELNGKGYLTSIPTASNTVLGGIKTNYSTNEKNYAVKVDSSGNAYVSVPWTDTNTTYTLSGLGGIGTIKASGSGALTLSASKSDTTVTISGSISNATTSQAGLMSSTHVSSLMNSVNNITTSYSNSNLYLNVSRTQGQNGFTVLLPLANSNNAGLMSPTQYGQLSNLDSTISTTVNNSLTSSTIINKLNRTDLVNKIGNATSTQDGLLSATDRDRFYGAINGVEYGTRAAAALNLVFSTVGSSNSVSGYNDISIAIPLATTQYAGLLTAAEKGKLNRIATSGTFAYLDKEQTWTEYQDFTAGAGNTGSDMRFKKNISEVDNILDKALGIDVISYIWNKEGETEKDTFGVNASQLEELGGVFKKIVHERNDETKTKWVEYDRIGVLALKALQEYKVKMDKVVEDLQNQIEELKKK